MFNRVKLMLAVALGRMLGSAPISLHRAAMDHNRTVDALRAAEESRSVAHRLAQGAARLLPRRRAKGNGYLGLNGAQAMARRVRQWRRDAGCAGMLYVGNVTERRLTLDSHGAVVEFYPS